MKTCSLNNCIRKYHAKGLCSMHLHRSNRQKGLEDSAEKSIWYTMRARCYNSNNHKYPRYGGRGIEVCERWLESFDNFFEDMGEKPNKSYSIERINNDGNYEPGNCKWASCKEQGNNRSNNFLLTIDGKTQTLTEWCEQYDTSYKTVWSRIKVIGMEPIEALRLPIPLNICKRGHKLYGNNLYIRPKTGQRICRACAKERVLKFKSRRLQNV